MTRSVLPVAAALALAGGLAGCSAAARPARISHVVYFDLHDPAEADALVADCHALLPTIPGVVAYAAGRHLDTDREMVDAAYDVGLYVGFDDAAAYDTYIDHPQHVQLVETWGPRIETLLVRDFLDGRP